MNSPVATTSPSSSILSASMPFAAYVDGRMPRPLRESAETKTFDEFVDEYQQELRTLIDAKLEKGEALDTSETFGEQAEKDAGGEVIDLMAALKASVERSRAAREKEPAKKKSGQAS